MTTRINVSNESLYGESKTLAGWTEWLTAKFNEVPVEYRGEALLEIDSIGGYEGEHHIEADVFYYRPETPEEIVRKKSDALVRAEEAERLAQQWQAKAVRLRKEAGESQ